MKYYAKTYQGLALTATLMTTILSTAVAETKADTSLQESTSKLLTASFEPRNVVKIEAGDFHFTPGQPAPVHTHVAPAIGYVSRGQIIYQVEGENPQLLREGDAFYEPAGPRILRFDNASATQEAIFIDFNLQQQGEPFIVFEEELTQAIDRRMLPTVELNGQSVHQVSIFVSELKPDGHKLIKRQQPILAYVAEGIIKLKTRGQETKRFIAGESFSLTVDRSAAKIINSSAELSAKVITFYLE